MAKKRKLRRQVPSPIFSTAPAKPKVALLRQTPTPKAPIRAKPEAPIPAKPEAPIPARPVAPVQAEQEAPVQAEQEAPIQVEQEAPVQVEQEAPVQVEQEAPVQAEQEAPVQVEQEAPVQVEQEAPVQVEQEASSLPQPAASVEEELMETDPAPPGCGTETTITVTSDSDDTLAAVPDLPTFMQKFQIQQHQLASQWESRQEEIRRQLSEQNQKLQLQFQALLRMLRNLS